MPSVNSSDSAHQRLTDLRNGLLRLHKALLESERTVYDRDVARITSRTQLLELVLHDAWFAWLHELSELVVLIDEILDAGEPATVLEVDRLIRQARALLTPSEEGAGFEKHYGEALQRDPDVVLAHAEMMKLVKTLG